LKILTFNISNSTPLHIFHDVINAFNRLGHIVNLVNLRLPGTSPAEKVDGLCGELVRFRPDFVFVINEEITLLPKLSMILTEMEIPYAVWSINNPFYWVIKELVSPYCIIFVQERRYIGELKRFGFDHVFFLPPAVNPRTFEKVEQIIPDERDKYNCDISFFGLSFYNFYRQVNSMMIKNPVAQSIINETIEILSKNPLLDIFDIFEQVQNSHHASLTFSKPGAKKDMMIALEYAATSIYRKEIIEGINDFDLHLYGDDGWEGLVNGKIEFYGMLNYNELLKLYKGSKINLNIPMVQLKSGVEQEVYDILACRSFVLVGYRPGIEDLFELGKEIFCYHDPEELRELCCYFLKHPSEREEMAKRAHLRVLNEHTYERRIENLVEIMQKRLIG
jgi:spore maturation protein CgeB